MIIFTGILVTVIQLAFVVSLAWGLALSLRYKRKIFALLLILYALCFPIMHFINQSDNKYSDTNHGFLGPWKVPALGLILTTTFGLQLYVILTHLKKSQSQ